MSEDAGAGVLRVTGLTVVAAASGAAVIDQVSLSVDRGEVLGVIGESGSGKTTMGLALLGHARRGLKITGGRVVVDGRDALALGPAELRAVRTSTISYVPQDPASALNPVLRAGTQLREMFLGSGLAEPEVTAAVEAAAVSAGLPDWGQLARRFPHQLSGGQQQRLVIAMAFAREPKVIVFDEPTTGLDVSTQRRILETVRRLCLESGVAAIYVSHDLAVVRSLADRLSVMYAGKVVEDGRASAVFAAPLHPYTAGLLASVPSIESDELPRGMEGQLPSVGAARSAGCAFAPRCALAEDRCRTEAPPPVTVPQSDHTSRCFRWNEVGSGRAHIGPVATSVSRPRRAIAGTPMLAVAELRVRYGEREIVHGVDIEIAKGECGAIVGSSGSGKTTIARCVVGLKPWSSGSILLGGEPLSPDLAKRSREAIRRVQYVFQNPYNSLNPRKTVEQLLTQPLRLLRPELRRARRQDAVHEALDDVALGRGYLHRYPSQLSGGESQRVAIARALVSRPDLLVCDEVTSSLDVSVQASIIQLLDKLRQERGLTTVFITHDLALVRSLAQHVVLLHDGGVVEQGATAQLLEKPETLYAAQFFADHPRSAVLVASGEKHAS